MRKNTLNSGESLSTLLRITGYLSVTYCLRLIEVLLRESASPLRSSSRPVTIRDILWAMKVCQWPLLVAQCTSDWKTPDDEHAVDIAVRTSRRNASAEARCEKMCLRQWQTWQGKKYWWGEQCLMLCSMLALSARQSEDKKDSKERVYRLTERVAWGHRLQQSLYWVFINLSL